MTGRPIADGGMMFLSDKSALPPLRLISPDHSRIAIDDRWKSFILWGYGLRSEENCARCPETARLLERVPGLMTASNEVVFSDGGPVRP